MYKYSKQQSSPLTSSEVLLPLAIFPVFYSHNLILHSQKQHFLPAVLPLEVGPAIAPNANMRKMCSTNQLEEALSISQPIISKGTYQQTLSNREFRI